MRATLISLRCLQRFTSLPTKLPTPLPIRQFHSKPQLANMWTRRITVKDICRCSAVRFTSSDVIKAKVRGIQKDILPLTTKKIIRKKKKDAIPSDQEVFDVCAYATSEEIDLEALKHDLEVQGLYVPLSMPDDVCDALFVEALYRIDDEPREVIFFREGSIVFWNVPREEREIVLEHAKQYQEDSYDRLLVNEEFESTHFSYTESASRLVGDEIQLRSTAGRLAGEQRLEKYAFSNAMSLSVKLAIWEASLARYVDSIEWVLEDLKEGKPLRISRAGVLKKSGELLTLRHLINLSSDLLDTPDFYWDREECEQLYNKTCNHFSISRRVKIMNEKLSSCFELTELLRAHLAEDHSSNLEWLIIFLIAIEVGFEILHVAERWWM